MCSLGHNRVSDYVQSYQCWTLANGVSHVYTMATSLFGIRTEDGTLTGRWSTESCIRIDGGEVKSRVICECSTLSSRYAVLREQSEEKEVC